MNTFTKNTLAASTLLLTSFSVSVQAAEYEIDPAHSSIHFKVNHLGFSKTVGRFNDFNGSFSDTSGKEKAEVTIQVASIDTNHAERDKHLRSPDFFDAKQYPTITFKSSKVKNGKLMGELTMHGKTREVTLDGVVVGEGKDPWGGYRKGFSGSTVVKRSDWGVSHFLPGVSDEVEISLNIEAIRK